MVDGLTGKSRIAACLDVHASIITTVYSSCLYSKSVLPEFVRYW